MQGSFGAVPTIDIGDLHAPDPAARRRVARELGWAAREVGFLNVVNHGLPAELVAALRAAAEAFFRLPMEQKMAWYIGGSVNHSGYVPEGEEVFAGGKIDRKEAFDVGLDCPGGGHAPMLGANLWPDVPRDFQPAVAAYYAAVAALARRLFRGFALALDLAEDFFERHLTQPPSQLRLIHYPFDADAEPDQEGIGAHTDYECFTILHPTGPGLEVRNGDAVWVDSPPVPGALVINIGDLLEAWTNGEFIATAHRVRRVNAERYSFPYFATVDYWTVVEPLPQFVSNARPARFPPIVSGEHLFAQTAQTFNYLKRRHADGLLSLPSSTRPLGSFGRPPAARGGESRA